MLLKASDTYEFSPLEYADKPAVLAARAQAVRYLEQIEEATAAGTIVRVLGAEQEDQFGHLPLEDPALAIKTRNGPRGSFTPYNSREESPAVLNLLRHLLSRGHQRILLTGAGGGGENSSLAHSLDRRGYTSINFGLEPIAPRFRFVNHGAGDLMKYIYQRLLGTSPDIDMEIPSEELWIDRERSRILKNLNKICFNAKYAAGITLADIFLLSDFLNEQLLSTVEDPIVDQQYIGDVGRFQGEVRVNDIQADVIIDTYGALYHGGGGGQVPEFLADCFGATGPKVLISVSSINGYYLNRLRELTVKAGLDFVGTSASGQIPNTDSMYSQYQVYASADAAVSLRDVLKSP